MMEVKLCVLMILSSASLVKSNLIIPKSVFGENDTDILMEKWRKLDKFFADGVSQISGMVIPNIIKMSTNFDISDECMTGMLKYLLGIRQQKEWAVHMLDATGKVSSGLLGGTLSDFGNYDGCLGIEVKDGYTGELDFVGQYCTVEFRPALPPKPPNYRYRDKLAELQNFTAKSQYASVMSEFSPMFYFVFLRAGLCLPSTCSIEDVQSIATYFGDTMGGYCNVPRCEIKQGVEISTDQWIIIGVALVLVVLCAIGTVVGKLYEVKENVSLPLQLVTAFSVPENIKRLLNTDRQASDVISVVDGIRFFSIVWVVLGHCYLFNNWQTLRHFKAADKGIISDFAFQAVMSGFLAVDTFFFISGLLLSFVTMKHVLKEGENTFRVPIMLIRRIWRLLPSTMLMVALTLLLPLVGSGPVWHETNDVTAEMCQKNWWTNIIFINNFLHPSEQCQSTTWFTACELQQFLAGLIFLAIVIRKVTAGFAFLVFLIVFSIVSTGVITYWYDLLPTILFVSPDPEHLLNFWHYTHFKPHVHVGGYAIGLGIGYLMARKKLPKLNMLQKSFGWILAVAFAMMISYGTYEWNSNRQPTQIECILYASCHRIIWVAAIAWMTCACAGGFGGFITSILSWRGFIPLSRLTFLVYLWHAMVIWYYMGNLRGPIDTTQVTMVWLFLGCLSISFMIAFVMYVICEGPFAQLEKIIVGRRGHSGNSKAYDVEKSTTNEKTNEVNGMIVYKI